MSKELIQRGVEITLTNENKNKLPTHQDILKAAVLLYNRYTCFDSIQFDVRKDNSGVQLTSTDLDLTPITLCIETKQEQDSLVVVLTAEKLVDGVTIDVSSVLSLKTFSNDIRLAQSKYLDIQDFLARSFKLASINLLNYINCEHRLIGVEPNLMNYLVENSPLKEKVKIEAGEVLTFSQNVGGKVPTTVKIESLPKGNNFVISIEQYGKKLTTLKMHGNYSQEEVYKKALDLLIKSTY